MCFSAIKIFQLKLIKKWWFSLFLAFVCLYNLILCCCCVGRIFNFKLIKKGWYSLWETTKWKTVAQQRKFITLTKKTIFLFYQFKIKDPSNTATTPRTTMFLFLQQLTLIKHDKNLLSQENYHAGVHPVYKKIIRTKTWEECIISRKRSQKNHKD